MSDNLQSTDFQPHVNQVFQVQLGDGQWMDLELVSVTELGAPTQDGGRRPFSLHFSGPINPGYLPQHTYQFLHETMGVFDLFIVPIGPQENRMRYEAIFT